jgi:hypothetical protein
MTFTILKHNFLLHCPITRENIHKSLSCISNGMLYVCYMYTYTAMGVRGGKQTTESVIIIHYWPIIE